MSIVNSDANVPDYVEPAETDDPVVEAPEIEEDPTQDQPKAEEAPAESPAMRAARMYRRLAAPFPRVHQDKRGGTNLYYIKTAQAVGRLNAVCGVDGWEFEVVRDGYDQESDTVWCLGRLTIHGPRRSVIREQWGGQKHNRRTSDKAIVNYSFDLKGAASEALKKCAQYAGVALYLAGPEEDALGIGTPAPQADKPEDKTEDKAKPSGATEKAAAPTAAAKPPPTTARPTAATSAPKGPKADPPPPTPLHGPRDTTAKSPPAQKAPPAQEPRDYATIFGDDDEPAPEPEPTYTWTMDGRVSSLINMGYSEPTKTLKQGFYASCGSGLSYKREDIFKLLGLDLKTQHLEDWLKPANTTIRALYKLVKLHHDDTDVHIPTLKELQPTAVA